MSISRPRVFFDISISSEPAGRVIIELFTDKTPKTCENFLALCTNDKNLSYQKCPFHRIIPDFMLQSGDITSSNGTGGKSIFSTDVNPTGAFSDENLNWRECDVPGLVCMANDAEGLNTSQFFITLDACPHLNGKNTIFGQVVAGKDVLEQMAKVRTDKEDCPLEPVLISRCGELERRIKGGETRKAKIESDKQTKRKSDSRSKSPDKNRKRSRSRDTRDERDEGDEQGDDVKKWKTRDRSKSPDRERRRRDSGDESIVRHRNRDHRSGRRSKSRSRSPKRKEDQRDSDRYHHDDSRDKRNGHRSSYLDRDQNRYWDRDGNKSYRKDERNGNHGYKDNKRYDEDRNDRLDVKDDENGNAVIFKGRGAMKYREPDRAMNNRGPDRRR